MVPARAACRLRPAPCSLTPAWAACRLRPFARSLPRAACRPPPRAARRRLPRAGAWRQSSFPKFIFDSEAAARPVQ